MIIVMVKEVVTLKLTVTEVMVVSVDDGNSNYGRK